MWLGVIIFCCGPVVTSIAYLWLPAQWLIWLSTLVYRIKCGATLIHFSPNKFRNFPNNMNFSTTKWKKITTTTLIPTNTLIWYTRVQSLIWDLHATLKCSKRQTAQNIALTSGVNLSLIFAIFPSSNSWLQSEANNYWLKYWYL